MFYLSITSFSRTTKYFRRMSVLSEPLVRYARILPIFSQSGQTEAQKLFSQAIQNKSLAEKEGRDPTSHSQNKQNKKDFTRPTSVNRCKQVKTNTTKSRNTCLVLSSKECCSKTQYFFSLRMVAKTQYFPGKLTSSMLSWSSLNTRFPLENKPTSSYTQRVPRRCRQGCSLPHPLLPTRSGEESPRDQAR